VRLGDLLSIIPIVLAAMPTAIFLVYAVTIGIRHYTGSVTGVIAGGTSMALLLVILVGVALVRFGSTASSDSLFPYLRAQVRLVVKARSVKARSTA
jgi:hypothetical protein